MPTAQNGEDRTGRKKKLHFYIHSRQRRTILKNVHMLYESAKRVNTKDRAENIYKKDFMVTQR
jgi:hypothetical protein